LRAEVVFAADRWKAAGIKPITCLLSESQLGYYRDLKKGLLGFYRAACFAVAHIPVDDDKSHYLSP